MEALFFRERPEWADVVPVPQDDGPNLVVPIAYSADFRDAMDYFRAVLAAQERSPRALQLTQAVIHLNAANYTVWHYRRVLLTDLKADLDLELDFVDELVEDNSKNYQLWYHRRWIAAQLRANGPRRELAFVEEVLAEDAKNYHAWSHRQWVLRELGGWPDELAFCDRLIEEDVCNNCAWNQRFFVLTAGPAAERLPATRAAEIRYAANAVRRAPANESAWRYLRGLFQGDAGGMVNNDVLVQLVSEILEPEPACVPALSLQLDLLLWGLRPLPFHWKRLAIPEGATWLQAAHLLCTRLEQADGMRALYWAWRRKSLPADERPSPP